jgi:hypothetical protein
LVIVGVTVLAAGALSLALPYNGYLRVQPFAAGQQFRLRWVFERIWFDPRPIDIAIVGPSQTLYGVSARDLEDDLAQRGYPGIHVANLSAIRPGEDLHTEIVRQLLAARQPKLVFIGVSDLMSRASHPAFAAIAAPSHVLAQTFYGNPSYFSNIMQAVYNQAYMFAVGVSPGYFGYDAAFDPARYRLQPQDAVEDETLSNGVVVDHTKTKSLAFLMRDRQQTVADIASSESLWFLGTMQFNVSRAGYRSMVDRVRGAGALPVFLYQPLFRGDAQPREQAFYDRLAPMVVADWGLDDWRLFTDAWHRNKAGAAVESDGLADWLVRNDPAMLAALSQSRTTH